MINSFVTTKIRPIRKLFIINNGDKNSFDCIFESLMQEIDGIFNIILHSNNQLFSPENIEFVNRFDPDIIINHSDLDNKLLSSKFNTIAYLYDSSEHITNRFGSPLFSFTGTPYLATKDPSLIPDKVFATSKLENSSDSLFFALNYGVLNKKDFVRLKRSPSIFQNTTVSCIEKTSNLKDTLFDNSAKFHNLTNEIGAAYSSSGFYNINYNQKRYFEERNKKYIFISKWDDLDFILYFWNTRCTYNSAKLAWIPLELLSDLHYLFDDDVILVLPNETMKSDISITKPVNDCIIADRYYFSGEKERWVHFEHDQYLTINSIDNSLTHPSEKSFSDIGFGGGFVFEIRGIAESNYPKKHFLGEVIRDKMIDIKTFPEYFTRFSNKGISIYFFHFRPYETSGITQSFRLLSFKDLLSHHFLHFNLVIKPTPKTDILEQLINILGGVQNAHLICEDKIFELLISLTPHTRTQQLIRKSLPDLERHSSRDDIIAYIGSLKEKGDIHLPSSVITMENIFNKLNLRSDEKVLFADKLQKIYDKSILFRGKNFKCKHCSATLWFPFESLERINYCSECGNPVKIPIFIDGQLQNDHYKLNQLVARAVDQGQLSTLLTINYIYKQGYNQLDFLSNYEIYTNDCLISDIDLSVKIGKKLGLCECKSHSSFNLDQINDLAHTAKIIGCDFILLSCLLDSSDDNINEAFNALLLKELDIPAFIVTKDEIFKEKPQRIFKYFDVNPKTGKHFTGPIIMGRS